MKIVTVIVPVGEMRRTEIREFVAAHERGCDVLFVEASLISQPEIGKVMGFEDDAATVEHLREDLFGFLTQGIA